MECFLRDNQHISRSVDCDIVSQVIDYSNRFMSKKTFQEFSTTASVMEFDLSC